MVLLLKDPKTVTNAIDLFSVGSLFKIIAPANPQFPQWELGKPYRTFTELKKTDGIDEKSTIPLRGLFKTKSL